MKYVILSITLLLSVQFVYGQEEKSTFKDTLDGALDMSEWLNEMYGFVPVPTIITEPAVGFGGALGLLFIDRNEQIEGGNPVPPDIAMAGGFYTSNKSWGVLGLYKTHFKEDQFRLTVGGMYASVNLTYYFTGPLGMDREAKFNIKGSGGMTEFLVRLGNKRIYAGLGYVFFSNDVVFDPGEILPDLDPIEFDSRIGGLGPVLELDTRDNTFTPNRGVRSRLKYRFNDEFLGSSFRFHQLEWRNAGYLQFSDKWIGGLRIDYQQSWDDTPFYAQPFVQLRGVPAMRYQGSLVLLAETEERWNFSSRWSVVAFAGLGTAANGLGSFDEVDLAYNFGTGIRYLVARLYGAYMGVDIARGPEQWAFYIQFGNAWF